MNSSSSAAADDDDEMDHQIFFSLDRVVRVYETKQKK